MFIVFTADNIRSKPGQTAEQTAEQNRGATQRRTDVNRFGLQFRKSSTHEPTVPIFRFKKTARSRKKRTDRTGAEPYLRFIHCSISTRSSQHGNVLAARLVKEKLALSLSHMQSLCYRDLSWRVVFCRLV